MSIEKSVLAKIKKEKIKPKPKIYFILINILFWILLVFFGTFGSLAFASTIFLYQNSDWDFYKQVDNNFLKFLFFSVPYFWILIFLIFFVSVYFFFKKTKSGYKYNFLKIYFFSFIFMFLTGYSFFKIGLGEKLEQYTEKHISVYDQINLKNHLWVNPEKGILVGIIYDINPEKKEIILIDKKQKKWNVNVSETKFIMKFPGKFHHEIEHMKENNRFKKTRIPNKKIEIRKKEIKIIGQKTSQNSFKAKTIEPWKPNRIHMEESEKRFLEEFRDF